MKKTNRIDWVEAANELLRRRRARKNFADFVQYIWPKYIMSPFHRYVADKLQDVVDGRTKRLMIFAPPQHGKSHLVSVSLPPYWLAHHPDWPVLMTSYGADLIQSKSRVARDILDSPMYRNLFPDILLNKMSHAIKYWRLVPPYRGFVLAVGVGGPITGHGGMLGIIDDPFENWEQAQSLIIRNKIWDWYRATFRTRIWENGTIVLIMTRWHEDDLAGRLLKEQSEEWEVLRFPALAETQEERDRNNELLGLPIGQPDILGREAVEPLCAELFSKTALEKIRADVGSLVWWAEYQGVPRAPEGQRIKRSWFKFVEVVPRKARRIRYWDKAGTERGGAYTAGVLMAKTPDGMYYVEDVVRGQWSAYEREKIIKLTAEMDAQKYNNEVVIYVEQEPGSGGKESAENTVRNLAGYPVRVDKPITNKDVRLEPFIAQLEAGNVFLLRGNWNGTYIEELVSIPNGRYRDQADATAGAFNKLARLRTWSDYGTPQTMRNIWEVQ